MSLLIAYILELLIYNQNKTKFCILCVIQSILQKVLIAIQIIQKGLKHKYSFGKSENLSKIFFGEILVFDHAYEGISSSSNNLLWITFIKKKK